MEMKDREEAVQAVKNLCFDYVLEATQCKRRYGEGHPYCVEVEYRTTMCTSLAVCPRQFGRWAESFRTVDEKAELGGLDECVEETYWMVKRESRLDGEPNNGTEG